MPAVQEMLRSIPLAETQQRLNFEPTLNLDRSEFLDEITKFNKSGLYPHDTSLAEFVRYYAQFNIPGELILAGFLHLKKEQLRDDAGNAINFIAHAVEAGETLVDSSHLDIGFNSEFSRQRLDGVIENILALAVEYPLAEATKKETREYKWQIKGDDWRLISPHGDDMDTILTDALVSSQKLSFERGRYLANQKNYQELKAGRKKEDQRVYVEFSPNPVVTTAAKKRGYLGNSTIFFFEYDQDKKTEVSHQRWLRAEWSDFYELLKENGFSITSANDVAVMRASSFISSEQKRKIEAFIDKHHGRIKDHEDELLLYVRSELRPFLRRELLSVVQTGARKLINGEDVLLEIKKIITTTTFAQHLLDVKIKELTGLKTRNSDRYVTLRQTYDYNHLMWDMDYRMAFVEQEELQLRGCGAGSSFGDSLFGDPVASIVGALEMKIPGVLEEDDPSKDPNLCRCSEAGGAHFHCPHPDPDHPGDSTKKCGHAIVVGKGTTSCPRCGGDKTC